MTELLVPQEIWEAARALTAQAGRGEVTSLEALSGGRNNRVYRVETPSGGGILKQYFRGPPSGRDRFGAEVAWYQYCGRRRIPQVAELWGIDPDVPCVLMGEIRGRKLDSGEATREHVAQAAEFLVDLNRDRAAAAGLPDAAEACFSLRDYVTGVDLRLTRLNAAAPTDDASQAMHEWLTGALRPLWTALRSRIAEENSGEAMQVALPESKRRLSPSDFGFHNAILDAQGKLWFFDFEYAGWDDPAKTVCDFFWQVDVPAPRAAMPLFLDAFRDVDSNVEERVRTLFPLFGVKWCTIVLNEFLQEKRTQRQFAGEASSRDDVLFRQLDIAKRLSDDVASLVESRGRLL